MDGRRLIEGRWIRWNAEQAEAAYAAGQWVRDTLGDALKRAAAHTPERVLLVDGDVRLDCVTAYRRASRLARAMLARTVPGSVVSFMLPNWHEAAIIYLAAHLAGMIVAPFVCASSIQHLPTAPSTRACSRRPSVLISRSAASCSTKRS